MSTIMIVSGICLCGLVASVVQFAGKSAIAQPQETTIDPEKRLQELGIELQMPAAPAANFVRAVRSGNLVFLSGHGPRKSDGSYLTGKVGREVSIEQGREAARLTAINLLASLKAEIGDLNKVQRVVKVLGMVNSGEAFTEQPQVMNISSCRFSASAANTRVRRLEWLRCRSAWRWKLKWSLKSNDKFQLGFDG